MSIFIPLKKMEIMDGGDLELSIAYEIFNINIAQYLLEKDENNNIINLKFIKYIVREIYFRD